MTTMDEALAANQAALDGGYCTVANEYHIKCAAPALFLLRARIETESQPPMMAHVNKYITEPVCCDHLASEIENALAANAPSVIVTRFEK